MFSLENKDFAWRASYFRETETKLNEIQKSTEEILRRLQEIQVE